MREQRTITGLSGLTALVLALVVALPAATSAQQHDAGAADGSSAVTERGDDVQAARDRLHMLLLRPDVRRTARDRGIDLRPVHEGIRTLGAEDLARVAPYADAVEDAAAAQSAVTISTTTIIIGLLLIILLVLIV